MSKAFCITGAVVAILMLLLFGTDLAIEYPFDRPGLWGWVIDISMVLCSGMLGYVSWATWRTLK